MKRVEKLIDDYDDKLEDFLNKLSEIDPCVLGYHYPFYRKMLKRIGLGESFYLGLFEGDKILAVLPGFIKTSDLGKVYSSLPFFGPNSGVLCINEKRIEYTKEITNYLLNVLDADGFISASIYSPFLSNMDEETHIMKDKFPLEIEKFTSYIDMKELSVSSKIRYDIRKSEKAGVIVSDGISDEKIDQFYKIYLQNCADFSIPMKPKGCIEELLKEALNKKNVSVYFAELDNVVIGGLIMIWSNSVASYYLPCALNEHRSLQPNTLLINQALNDAIEREIKYWNWESSPSEESGVYKFKKKWGSTDVQYKIFLKAYKEEQFFKNLGMEEISKAFPHYYVYPFHKLEPSI